MDEILTNEDFILKLAENASISGTNRLGNTLVVGSKNTGKTTKLLPIMAQNDINNKECGATFIVGRKDISCMLYGMAKKAKRKVVFLKPSIDENAHKLLYFKSYEHNRMKEIIDYEEAISKKMIVIIDMEYAQNGNDGIRATAMLLSQLQLSMQVNEDSKVSPHFIYIDDAQYYLPYIELLLTCGDDYGIGTTLFIQSKSQMIDETSDYTNILQPNINNFIFMNSLVYEDCIYYQKQQVYFTLKEFVGRKYNQIICETKTEEGERSVTMDELSLISETEIEDCLKNGLSYKKKMAKKMLGLIKEQEIKNAINTPSIQKPIEKSITKIYKERNKKKHFVTEVSFEEEEEL
ncbi:hypothetical protein [Bacillus sp. NPDC094106]|uniref:hypothetical protein n=1 Tax=Bacillus sp. NPDC094106 TaxID=3363949 RepID=UPI0037F57151